MYKKFYGFKESPFNLTPNSRFFFPSSKHNEALNSILYAIEERKGFIVITGDIGSGKTTVCRTAINQLESNTQVALITNSHLTGEDLLITVLDDLEVNYTPGTKARLLSQFNDYLLEQVGLHNNVVLIIDEAQNLGPEVLEEVRMLSNLETENEKLIQIILIGQPELKAHLRLASLEQLRQRISVYFHLTPLSLDETKEYINHRLSLASESDRQFITDEAIEVIYQYTKGVPRLVNQICDSAFITGYVEEAEIINGRIIQEVIEEHPVFMITTDPDDEHKGQTPYTLKKSTEANS